MPHSRSLLRVAYRLTASSSAAEDLVQETLLLAWRSFHQFKPDSNIRAWLFSILVNSFRSRARGKSAAQLVPPVLSVVAESPDLDEGIEIKRALDSLEVEHRTVLLLGAVEGFTCREIAGILAIPIGTVMSRLSRARQAMRKRLESRAPGVQYAGQD